MLIERKIPAVQLKRRKNKLTRVNKNPKPEEPLERTENSHLIQPPHQYCVLIEPRNCATRLSIKKKLINNTKQKPSILTHTHVRNNFETAWHAEHVVHKTGSACTPAGDDVGLGARISRDKRELRMSAALIRCRWIMAPRPTTTATTPENARVNVRGCPREGSIAPSLVAALV